MSTICRPYVDHMVTMWWPAGTRWCHTVTLCYPHVGVCWPYVDHMSTMWWPAGTRWCHTVTLCYPHVGVCWPYVDPMSTICRPCGDLRAQGGATRWPSVHLVV